MEKAPTLPEAKRESVWSATSEMPGSIPLPGDVETDVCIVGAGIAGLTAAYLLSKGGKRVVVLDDGRLASGMTQVTTAHLSNAIDDRFIKIERWHGEEGARLAAESHAAAIDCIESISRELKISCDFQRLDGLFIPRTSRRGKSVLDKLLVIRSRFILSWGNRSTCITPMEV
jgi:FAD dependent oxidoreductase